MTAQVLPFGGDDVNARLTLNIELIRTYRQIPSEDLYRAIGMTKGTYFNRRRGQNLWTAAEVSAVAAVLGVPVALLYERDLLPQVPPAQAHITRQFLAGAAA